MRIPADCVLIDGMDITVDEKYYHHQHETIVRKSLSSPDGDNHRENPDPFILAKSLVMTGSGRAVICCVGENTRAHEKDDEGSIEDLEIVTPL